MDFDFREIVKGIFPGEGNYGLFNTASLIIYKKAGSYATSEICNAQTPYRLLSQQTVPILHNSQIDLNISVDNEGAVTLTPRNTSVSYSFDIDLPYRSESIGDFYRYQLRMKVLVPVKFYINGSDNVENTWSTVVPYNLFRRGIENVELYCTKAGEIVTLAMNNQLAFKIHNPGGSGVDPTLQGNTLTISGNIDTREFANVFKQTYPVAPANQISLFYGGISGIHNNPLITKFTVSGTSITSVDYIFDVASMEPNSINMSDQWQHYNNNYFLDVTPVNSRVSTYIYEFLSTSLLDTQTSLNKQAKLFITR